MLLHIFRTQFQTDRNPLNERRFNKTDLFFSFLLFANTELLSRHLSGLLLFISDLEFPVVELPPWGVVVSEVSPHPDVSLLQSAQVFRAQGQQCLLILLRQGDCDSTGDDDNLANRGKRTTI